VSFLVMGFLLLQVDKSFFFVFSLLPSYLHLPLDRVNK
jgi:hypothetical protein